MLEVYYKTLDVEKKRLFDTKYIKNEAEREERITIQKIKIEILEELIAQTLSNGKPRRNKLIYGFTRINGIIKSAV